MVLAGDGFAAGSRAGNEGWTVVVRGERFGAADAEACSASASTLSMVLTTCVKKAKTPAEGGGSFKFSAEVASLWHSALPGVFNRCVTSNVIADDFFCLKPNGDICVNSVFFR